MKAKEIQELLDFIANSGLAEVNIETEQFKISVKKHPRVSSKIVEGPIAQYVPTQPVIAPQPQLQPAAVTTTTPQAAKEEKTAESASGKNLITIKSPMIGTFYRSSNPDTPAFVNVGDEIKPGQTVCIIEAMKLFNEIESEVSGKVVKILVDNATPVEYDQPLFLIEPK